MKRPNIRALQAGLLGLVAVMIAAVALSVRRPTSAPAPAPTPASSEAPGPGPHMEGFVFRKLDKDGHEKFVLRAQTMTGQEQEQVRLKGVSMTFPYVARDKPGNATVTADSCVYTPANQKAAFTGNVVVKTEDGLDLHTDALVYRGDKGLARTESALTFARKKVSGSSTGAIYEAEKGKLQLLADAKLRVEDDDGGPTLEIQSASAELDREEGALRFTGDAVATRGQDRLKGAQIILVFATEDQTLRGLTAQDDVELTTAGGTKLPGMPGTERGKGPRILKCSRLDVSFHPDRTMESATAGPYAELTLRPGPGEAKERRRLKARFLTFHFDETGRLEEVEGQKDASLTVEAIAPAKGETRTVECRSFTAQLDPETGDTNTIDFRNDVVMTKGTQRAKADSGWYVGAKNRLTLEKDPEILDLSDGSRLSAVKILIATDTGNIEASREVRQILGKSGDKPRPGPLGRSDEPTFVTAGTFSYEAKTKTSRYMEGAVLRSGKDELRAPVIRVIEDKNGKRKLAGLEGVVSLFHPKETPGKPPPAPVETHAQQLAYDEAAAQAVYTGDVVIRQGDIVSRSPEATMTFTPDGSQIQTVVAGEPVEIEQGLRKANGTKATYTPASETLVIVGDKVTLKEPTDTTVAGRSLTFHVGDDRILMDGREEVRTETILKKEPPKP